MGVWQKLEHKIAPVCNTKPTKSSEQPAMFDQIYEILGSGQGQGLRPLVVVWPIILDYSETELMLRTDEQFYWRLKINSNLKKSSSFSNVSHFRGQREVPQKTALLAFLDALASLRPMMEID